ncbi:MAG: hypothetical protein WDZ79_01615 [Candidatus Paceibacterota bacterium]
MPNENTSYDTFPDQQNNGGRKRGVGRTILLLLGLIIVIAILVWYVSNTGLLTSDPSEEFTELATTIIYESHPEVAFLQAEFPNNDAVAREFSSCLAEAYRASLTSEQQREAIGLLKAGDGSEEEDRDQQWVALENAVFENTEDDTEVSDKLYDDMLVCEMTTFEAYETLDQ